MYDKEQDYEVNPTASLLNFQRNTETPQLQKGDKSKRSLIPYVDDPESRSFALAAGLFQLFAYICVIPHIISVAISIHMLRHNLISKGIRRVTIFCVFELLAFTLVPFFHHLLSLDPMGGLPHLVIGGIGVWRPSCRNPLEVQEDGTRDAS